MSRDESWRLLLCSRPRGLAGGSQEMESAQVIVYLLSHIRGLRTRNVHVVVPII